MKDHFLQVDKSLIDNDVSIGDEFVLEVSEVGEKITLQLKRKSKFEKSERVPFSDVFTYTSGVLVTKVPVRISGVEFGVGVSCGNGVTMGGINFYLFIGRELSVIKRPDVWIIDGIY